MVCISSVSDTTAIVTSLRVSREISSKANRSVGSTIATRTVLSCSSSRSARKRLADLVFRKIPAFDQHAPELAPRAALVLQGRLELLLRDELLLHQQIAEPYPLGTLGSDRFRHDLSAPSPPRATSGCRRGQRYRVPGKGANAPFRSLSPSCARAASSSPLNREGRSLANCSRVGNHRRVC